MIGRFRSLFSESNQLARIVILAGVLLVLLVVAFGSYYYYDRYYSPKQPEIQDVTLAQAEQAVRDEPSSAENRLNLAESYLINREFKDALAQVNQVLIAEPDNQRGWLVAGVANTLNGTPADAIEPLQKYVDANKDSEMQGLNKSLLSAAYYLGDAYLQLGQPDKAVEPLQQAVEWSQTDADAMYKLGLAYIGIKDYPNAIFVLKNATTFVPNFTEAYTAMAQVFDADNQPDFANFARGMEAYSKKDYKTAEELLLKASQALPDFGTVFAGLGLVFEAQGKLNEAKTAYETALQVDSGNFAATNGLERVTALLNK